MAKFKSEVVEDKDGNKSAVWHSVQGIRVPGEVWNELYRRAKKAGWDEEKIEPYVWEGKSLIIQQKEPNAGKIKELTAEEADPKIKGQDKVVVELLERVAFLERRLKEAEEPTKPEAEKKAPKEKAPAVVASPEALAFSKVQWKKAVVGLEAGDFDALLGEVSREPVLGTLSPAVQKAVEARLKVVMNG